VGRRGRPVGGSVVVVAGGAVGYSEGFVGGYCRTENGAEKGGTMITNNNKERKCPSVKR